MTDRSENKGEISDGHHTFNQLYHQRAILFATIVNQNKDKAWKSFKHSDGHYCFDEDGEMFIVGIDTPKGSYTYHYHKKYWDYFDCKELECGKAWDGHTEEDVTRLLSLEQQPSEEDFVKHKKEVLERIAKREREIDKYIKELEALKQQPCEDCVSREAVIDFIIDNYGVGFNSLTNGIRDYLPPVTPKRPKGKWIFCYGNRGKDNVEKCSCCKSYWKEAVIYRYDTQEYLRLRLKYCPKCGAEMEGEEDANNN